MKKIEDIANELYEAELNKTTIPPIRMEFPSERDIESAYKIQQLVSQKKILDGAKPIGKKIGLTSFAVQVQLGVNEPDFGILTDRMQIENRGSLSYKSLMQPKVEAEWAFILKDNLNNKVMTLDKVKDAIDYACVAIEIVGSRIENWNIKITDTIADNASASHFVLGDQKIKLSDIDLENCHMQLFKNKKLVSEGTGKDCMGNPLKAVLWLARAMQERGKPLRAGEVILSGALGPMTILSQGDSILAKIDKFDEVSLNLK